MSDRSASTERRLGLRGLLLLTVANSVLLALCCGGCWMLFGRDELLATFSIGARYTLNVYAEPEFHYEPPGYLSFEIEQRGRTHISRRRFMGIGFERKPRQNFAMIATDDDDVVALLLSGEVQMIHEFSSGFTWPGPYTNVTESQWETAELLLQKLRATNPDIRCPRQDEYRRELDRQRQEARKRSQGQPTPGRNGSAEPGGMPDNATGKSAIQPPRKAP